MSVCSILSDIELIKDITDDKWITDLENTIYTRVRNNEPIDGIINSINTALLTNNINIIKLINIMKGNK